MTSVPAYYGPRGIIAEACPIGYAKCFDYHRCCGYMEEKTVTMSKAPGPVTVLCSAPTKKGKGHGLEPGNH